MKNILIYFTFFLTSFNHSCDISKSYFSSTFLEEIAKHKLIQVLMDKIQEYGVKDYLNEKIYKLTGIVNYVDEKTLGRYVSNHIKRICHDFSESQLNNIIKKIENHDLDFEGMLESNLNELEELMETYETK